MRASAERRAGGSRSSPASMTDREHIAAWLILCDGLSAMTVTVSVTILDQRECDARIMLERDATAQIALQSNNQLPTVKRSVSKVICRKTFHPSAVAISNGDTAPSHPAGRLACRAAPHHCATSHDARHWLAAKRRRRTLASFDAATPARRNAAGAHRSAERACLR